MNVPIGPRTEDETYRQNGVLSKPTTQKNPMNESTANAPVAVCKWVNRFELSVSNRGLDESTVRSTVEVKAQIFNEVTD